MDIIDTIFGQGKDLNALQMSMRGIVIFLITLLLIRISGRRTFGMGSAFDNIIVILLGSILARAVVGVSAFIPTVLAALAIALMHRLLGWISIVHRSSGHLLKGDKIILYENGDYVSRNLKRALLTRQDLQASLRKSLSTDSFEEVDCAYMECNGQISFVRKQVRESKNEM